MLSVAPSPPGRGEKQKEKTENPVNNRVSNVGLETTRPHRGAVDFAQFAHSSAVVNFRGKRKKTQFVLFTTYRHEKRKCV
ncbi:hypothetical protein ZHAS_00010986 [Anopheles sinensis]|uniref:Uncharacterized protein n=1 Tax=Anopheles sinensis TaxID=74873 RepID=A0A084VYY5_ANOSI|nr:hypothetical protein ZHAS_00010986 [Anopheles sinensis]